MDTKPHLGISPGTRVIGFAVMYGGELVEWKVKTFKSSWSNEKAETIIASILQICKAYKIDTVAIKRINPDKSSKGLDTLLNSVIKQLQNKNIKVAIHSLADLDYDKKGKDRLTKKKLSEGVVEKYPVLRKTLQKERSNRTEYYSKMFEAIAIAEQCNI